MFKRAALSAGKHLGVDAFRVFFLAEDEAAARASEAFVGGGRYEVGERHGGWMYARSDEAGDVRHIDEEVSADGVRDCAHAFEIDDTGVSACPSGDHAGFGFESEFREVVVIDALVIRRDAVVDDVEETPGEVGFVSVGEVSPVSEVHGQDAVAGLEDGEVHGHVGLRTGVRLDVGVFRVEETFCAIDGKLFNDIYIFASAVPAFSWVAFGVFIGEAGSLGLHDGFGCEVFGGDQFDVLELAECFGLDGSGDFWVGAREGGGCVIGEVGEFFDPSLVASAFEGG